MEGRAYLIGCGFAKEHLTLEAIDAIRRADVLLYDRLMDERILDENKRAEKIYVGKKPGESSKQSSINDMFLKYRGKIVARLHAGDSFVFGRGYEEYLFLRKNNIPVSMIPGISAFAALEKFGLPITYRETASSFACITGTRKGEEPDSEPEFTDCTGICADTLIFYMSVMNLKNVVAQLKKDGKHTNSDYLIIENAFRENYRIISGTIETIAGLAGEARIKPPALLVVGTFKRKLESNNLLMFRQKENEPETKAQLKGFNITNIPLIKIENNVLNPAEIPRNKIYAFTSPNAVKSVFGQLKLEGRFIAIGNITKKCLEEYVALKDITVPETQTSNGLMGMLEKFKKEDVIVFCSEYTKVAGFKKIYCYKTEYPEDEKTRKAIDGALENGDTGILFLTSSEILRHLAKLVPKEKLNEKTIVALGPMVAIAAKDAGLHIDFMLEKPDIGDLKELIPQ